MTKRRLAIGAVLLVAAMLVAAYALVFSAYEPMPEARAALASDAEVTVTAEPWLTFRPADAPPATGLVLYTGARVPPEAYAPLAREIAAAGYLVVIPSLPLNFAVFDSDAATAVIEAHPEVDAWAVGGHSLGGAMAARFAGGTSTVAGLVLLASYPESGLDLADAVLDVVVISGSADEIATPEEIEDGLTRLPASARPIEIAGGNHAQFGWYGEQPGDGEATISRAEQGRAMSAAIIELLERLSAATD